MALLTHTDNGSGKWEGGNGAKEKRRKKEKLTARGSFHLPGNERQLLMTVEAGTVILSPYFVAECNNVPQFNLVCSKPSWYALPQNVEREKEQHRAQFHLHVRLLFFILFFLDVHGEPASQWISLLQSGLNLCSSCLVPIVSVNVCGSQANHWKPSTQEASLNE